MAEYTPTTVDVRDGYSASRMISAFYAGGEEQLKEGRAEFDRWLDVVIREAKAKALEEAADAMGVDLSFRDPLRLRAGWLRDRAERIRGRTDE